jgi:LmbE family N-acetylglucosaminyl deacetylase
VLLLCAGAATAQQSGDDPVSVLIVTAHPDDESGMAATVYKITHFLGGTVDLALVTNGEGGYKYSSLAESIYGLELTDEQVGRQYLPAIRKRELMAGGEIIGLRNYFFLDQQDHKYTLNVDSVLNYVWDVPFVTSRLKNIMTDGDYDYVFVFLPVPSTHGHHKAASILALRAAAEVDAPQRPIVLGVTTAGASDTVEAFTELDGYPITRVKAGTPSFAFDRSQKFGFRNRLDYKIIVNWLIAEHKSQGTMRPVVDGNDLEQFWYFDMNDPARKAEVQQLFDRLNAREPELEGKAY